MAGLESKSAENGDVAAPIAADSVKVEMGDAHLPSAETISAAEALKAEGNALLGGELFGARGHAKFWLDWLWGLRGRQCVLRGLSTCWCGMEVRLPYVRDM